MVTKDLIDDTIDITDLLLNYSGIDLYLSIAARSFEIGVLTMIILVEVSVDDDLVLCLSEIVAKLIYWTQFDRSAIGISVLLERTEKHVEVFGELTVETLWVVVDLNG